MTVETIDRMLAVGLKGVFWGIQALLALRDPAVPAAIVNLASPAADLGIANAATYSTIKGGIVSLTRQLAVELGPQGVRVNAVAPGSVPTPGARTIVDEAGFAKRREQAPLAPPGPARGDRRGHRLPDRARRRLRHRRSAARRRRHLGEVDVRDVSP